MLKMFGLLDSRDHIGSEGDKDPIQLLRRVGYPGQSDGNRNVDTLDTVAMPAVSVLSLRRIVAVTGRPRVIVIGALLMKGRLEFDMTVGPETQNDPMHRTCRQRQADKQGKISSAHICCSYDHDHISIIA